MIASRPMVEVLGVAGAGKTTLVDLLILTSPGARKAEFIHSRNLRHLAYLLWSIPSLLPMLTLNVLHTPRITWREFKLFVYVSQWARVLRREHPNANLVLLDQGPLYCLVRLQALGKGVTRTAWFSRYRSEMIRRWSDELDAVVFLDANDGTLTRRINDRSQQHVVKNQDTGDVRDFLNRYRDLFRELVHLLPDDGPRILDVDTSESRPAEIATRVSADLEVVFAGGPSVNRPGSIS